MKKSVALGVFSSVALASGACAHAMLETAVPAVGATVKTAPAVLVLRFSERLEQRFSSVVVTAASGAAVGEGAIRTDPADGRRLLVPVSRLAAGVYTVVWHAVSVDTHRTEGSYRFTVAP